MAVGARKRVAKRSKTAKKTPHAKGPHARKRAAKKKTTRPQRQPRVGEEARIALRRERVLLATAGGASLRQIAAELDVSLGTVHEDASSRVGCGGRLIHPAVGRVSGRGPGGQLGQAARGLGEARRGVAVEDRQPPPAIRDRYGDVGIEVKKRPVHVEHHED